MNLETLPRVLLAVLPTPVHDLGRLSRILGGPRLLVKRDDLTGLAFGGNKTRKLEYLVGEALASDTDTLITTGAAQSNHCRQTAAAAARAGLACHLVLDGAPRGPEGNLLLDLLLGAQIHWAGQDRRGEIMARIAEDLRAQDHRPFVIPYGGSTATGAVAYAVAMGELVRQLHEQSLQVDLVVVASSSGGTQAGLTVGARAFGFQGQILGISVDKGERSPEPYEGELAALASAAADRMGHHEEFAEDDFWVDYDYLGDGYGVVGDREREAITLVAQTEGLLLDPVYTAKAMGALIDMVRRGLIGESKTVLFWHTGGGPALFAYARDLLGGRHGAVESAPPPC